MTATITPPERGMARRALTCPRCGSAELIPPAERYPVWTCDPCGHDFESPGMKPTPPRPRTTSQAAPARPIFSDAVALALAKLVSPEWLALGVHIAGHTDYTDMVDGEPAEWIVVTVGVPTDGPKFQRGRGYALAQAIGAVRPVCEVAHGR